MKFSPSRFAPIAGLAVLAALSTLTVRAQVPRAPGGGALAPAAAPVAPFTPFQMGKNFTLDTNQGAMPFSLYVVPDGMRLVIEYASLHYNVNSPESGGNVRLQLVNTAGGTMTTHELFTLPANRAWNGGSEVVRIYCDPKTTVRMILERNQRAGAHGDLSISGHLEPVR